MLTFSASEIITTPSVLIAGRSVSPTPAGAASWSAQYTVVTNQVTEGSASLSIAFNDLASNGGSTVSAVTDSSVVTIDLTPPTLTSVSIVSDNAADTTRANAGDTITLSIAASEPILVPTVSIAGRGAGVVGSGVVIHELEQSSCERFGQRAGARLGGRAPQNTLIGQHKYIRVLSQQLHASLPGDALAARVRSVRVDEELRRWRERKRRRGVGCRHE